MAQDPWNSLEVAKLVIAGLTPIILVFIGLAVQRTLKQFEHQQWRSQKLIEKRIAIYDLIAPQLNFLLCYFIRIGDWRDTTPPQIIKLKRELDRAAHLAKPLFSPQFFRAYTDFMGRCFETYTGEGKDARLRTGFKRRKEVLAKNWDSTWEQCFSDKPTSDYEISAAYEHLMAVFAGELGVCEKIGSARTTISRAMRL